MDSTKKSFLHVIPSILTQVVCKLYKKTFTLSFLQILTLRCVLGQHCEPGVGR